MTESIKIPSLKKVNAVSKFFPRTFCTLAWTQIHVTPTGVVKPCCVYEDSIKKEDGSVFRITDDIIENIWNSKSFNELRVKMLNGENVEGCAKCYQEEKISQTSDRIKHFEANNDLVTRVNYSKANNGATKDFPHKLNLKVGNNCNLKCRMCQPLDSSLIDNEFLKISRENPEFRSFDNASAFDYNYDEIPIELLDDWILNPLAVKNIQKIMKGVDELALAGGEIIVTPEVMTFLQFCIDQGYSKNISLFISTNLTRVTEDLINILAAFKVSTVLASIDGVENALEYIRYPSKWNTVYSNFIKLVNGPENVIPVLAPTVQIYNVLNIVDVLEIVDKIQSKKWEKREPYIIQPCHLAILFSPQHLSIRCLPKKIKEIAYQRIKKYYETSAYAQMQNTYQLQLELLMNTLLEENDTLDNDKMLLSHFMKYTEDLDKSRNQRMQDYLPELYNLLKEENLVPSYPRNSRDSFSFHKYRDKGFKSYEMRDFKEAIYYFEKANELYKEDEELLFSLKRAYEEMAKNP